MSKIGILLLNMGGPETALEVKPFLTKLFSDKMLINLPLQSISSHILAARRAPVVEKQYRTINYSPLPKWSHLQGQGLVDSLNKNNKDNKFEYHLAHRYSPEKYTTEIALNSLKNNGVKRAIAFSNYPQYSCTTSGSSFEELWRLSPTLSPGIEWSVIDRWWNEPKYIRAIVDQMERGLKEVENLDKTHIVFSAHSLPFRTIVKGDQYVPEIAATCAFAIKMLKEMFPEYNHLNYTLAWQSKVGPLPWMGPPTQKVLENLAEKNYKDVMMVPIGFISDHIETTYEIDITYAEFARSKGISNFSRAPSLNDSPFLIDAMTSIVQKHLQNPKPNEQFSVKCMGCQNPLCRRTGPLE